MATRLFHSTPPRPTARGFNPYSTKPTPLAEARKKQLRENMQGYFLGPMDPTKFMDSFMPVNPSSLGCPPDELDFSPVYSQRNEKSMYDPFIKIANATCTNFIAKFTGDRADSDTLLKPDITFFSKNNPAALHEDFDKASPTTSFQNMELFVELKHDTHCDPFRDETVDAGSTIERRSIDGENTRGQCALYAANQLAYQHRLFAFSLVICGRRVRFIRWDREGAVVSAGVDCSTNSGLVIEFLQRFNQMTAEQRGLDPTATPATPEEIEAFESAVAKVEIESLKRSVGAHAAYPRFRLEIRDANDEVSQYIVGKALDYNLGIVGRCTRGYLALDLSTDQPVFLKDMWRPDVQGVEPEHVWYEKLAAANVPFLVKIKHGSDVVQSTSTPFSIYHGKDPLKSTDTTSRQWAQRGLTHRLAGLFGSHKPKLQGHVHYRLVQTELCQPLWEFTNSNHLVLVVLHSLKACKSTFVDASLFHRDVSLGNIMIGLDNEGRLNDWDLCRDVGVAESLEGPRTGTWQFISTRLLESPGSKHTLSDDLESHFFVLMWAALHWVKHDKAGEIDMGLIFDQKRPLPHGIVDGGMGKSEMYKSEQKELHNVEFSCKPFNNLFWGLWELFSEYNKQRWATSGSGRRMGLRSRNVTGSGMDSTPRPEPSVSPEEMIELFETALELEGWTNDKVADQFPRTGSTATSYTNLSKVEKAGDVDGPAGRNPPKRRWISKSAGNTLEPEASTKRAKLE